MSGPPYTPPPGPGPSSQPQYVNPNYYPQPPQGYPAYPPGYNPYQNHHYPQQMYYPQRAGPSYYPQQQHQYIENPQQQQYHVHNPYAHMEHAPEGYQIPDGYAPYPNSSPSQYSAPYAPQYNQTLQPEPNTPNGTRYSPAPRQYPSRYPPSPRLAHPPPSSSWTQHHAQSPRLAQQPSPSPRMHQQQQQHHPASSPRTPHQQSPRLMTNTNPATSLPVDESPRAAPVPAGDPSESIPPPPSRPPPSQPPKAQEPIPPPTTNGTTEKTPTSFRSKSTIDANPSVPSSPTTSGGWAIWSRHPRDPSHAPGIIISPRAGAPQHVTRQALALPTPPASPEPSVAEQLKSLPNHRTAAPLTFGEIAPATSPTKFTFGEAEMLSELVSVAKPPPTTPKKSVAKTPKVTKTTEPVVVVVETPATPVVEPVEPEAAVASSSTLTPPVAAAAAPAPTVPAVKKSWASLLSSGSKSSLPTSSIVGFSIPASATPAGLANESRKKDLARLLGVGTLARAFTTTNGVAGAPRLRTRGLNNTGNMCFANAVLQALIYCPPFESLFRELGKVVKAGEKYADPLGGKEAGAPLVDATLQFLKEFDPVVPKAKAAAVNGKNGKGKEREEEEEEDWPESFTPSFVYDAMKEKKRFAGMVGGHQEDAEEFLGFFLDTLEEELLSIAGSVSPAAKKEQAQVEETEERVPKEDGWLEVGKKNKMVVTRTITTTESPITRIFGGKFRSTVRVAGQKDSSLVEDWRSLRLDIQREGVNTIHDALAQIAQPQTVSLSSKSRPNVMVDGSQLVLVEALPPVLVLHIKRFEYDTTVKGVVKISKQVAFGPDLEISSDLKAASLKAEPARYKLIGVVYHHGATATGGHYTLDVLHPTRDSTTARPREGWVRIDDEFVSDVRPDDVFGALDREDRCAYLLFYTRVGAPVAANGHGAKGGAWGKAVV